MTYKSLIGGIALATVLAMPAFAIDGFYQTIDDETNSPKSIVAVYEYQNKVYGRILLTYNTDGTIKDTIKKPTHRADKVKGEPFMVGLDIIWDMVEKDDDDRYSGGRIMDPKKGSIYKCELWEGENDTLNVRGKIGPFGRTQVWHELDKKSLPSEIKNVDYKTFVPAIPEEK